MNELDRARLELVGARALSRALFDTDQTGGPWRRDGRCVDADPLLFDGETVRTREQARRICSACPVQRRCAEDQIAWESAVPSRTRYLTGVVGGLAPADRFRIHHPHHPNYAGTTVPASTPDSKAA